MIFWDIFNIEELEKIEIIKTVRASNTEEQIVYIAR